MLPGHCSATPPQTPTTTTHVLPPPPPRRHAVSYSTLPLLAAISTGLSRQCTLGRPPRERQSLAAEAHGFLQVKALRLLRIRSWPALPKLHIPPAYTYFISLAFSEGAKYCRRIFVMVLKGLSASKPRELVVQPISETTQSFPRRRRERARARVDKIPRLSSQFGVLT